MYFFILWEVIQSHGSTAKDIKGYTVNSELPSQPCSSSPRSNRCPGYCMHISTCVCVCARARHLLATLPPSSFTQIQHSSPYFFHLVIHPISCSLSGYEKHPSVLWLPSVNGFSILLANLCFKQRPSSTGLLLITESKQYFITVFWYW